ncbi:hypothetical protein [Enterobacter ludwigii]|uniref:hypothetical protein n=1 Tax=Enterobacter ludwigii TaxID=299767 RepID=UPI00202637CF|nr:hypothetical protein [Enterobacter ludwigii]
MLVQDGSLPGQEQWCWDAVGNPLEGSAEKVTHNRLTQLNGIRWRYDIHGRTVEKDNGQTRWRALMAWMPRRSSGFTVSRTARRSG